MGMKNESIEWVTNLQSGLYLYSDGSTQRGIKLNSGPIFTLGSFKRNFLDYTVLRINGSYGIKSGNSPFSFDNIGDNSIICHIIIMNLPRILIIFIIYFV